MIVGHIMGIPVEESFLQLAPAGAATLTVLLIAGRTRLTRLGRRLRNGRLGPADARNRVVPGK